MKTLRAALVSCLLIACGRSGHNPPPPGPDGSVTPPPDGSVVPPDAPPPHAAPDHVVIVMEENHASGQILGNATDAAYFNELVAKGKLFTSSFAIEHPSQPNYLDLFSGSNQGITDDSCPHTFSGANLGSELIAKGLTFAGYSEDLPSVGATDCDAGDYHRKHAPWVNFSNVPASANQTMAQFPADFTQLPTVSFVIPNQQHDMHDGTIQQADVWLRQHLSDYANWAVTHNSLLIVTFDEDDHSDANHIFTIVVGADVPIRRAPERVTHFNWLRTLLDLYQLPMIGPNAQPIDLWDHRTVDVHRTVVFISGMTQPGQNLFARGGIDYGYAQSALNRDCGVDPGACQIPLHHRNLIDASTMNLKTNDDFLDWIGAEPNQDGTSVGTPTDFTIDQWPTAWGPKKTVAMDGYGEEPLNTWGTYWMLDVDMDCAQTVNGWFEIKSFITNGPGWEGDVTQAGTPYPSKNHMGQCGKLNKFDRDSGAALIQTIP